MAFDVWQARSSWNRFAQLAGSVFRVLGSCGGFWKVARGGGGYCQILEETSTVDGGSPADLRLGRHLDFFASRAELYHNPTRACKRFLTLISEEGFRKRWDSSGDDAGKTILANSFHGGACSNPGFGDPPRR